MSKKVYVETTVVSDATALPARDVFLYVAMLQDGGRE